MPFKRLTLELCELLSHWTRPRLVANAINAGTQTQAQ